MSNIKMIFRYSVIKILKKYKDIQFNLEIINPFVKDVKFLPFAENIGKNICKKINKNCSIVHVW